MTMNRQRQHTDTDLQDNDDVRSLDGDGEIYANLVLKIRRNGRDASF
jgi:hypothetical protein